MAIAPGAAGVPPPTGEGGVIRVVTDGAPWPGTIVREEDGSTTLHVDAALLAETRVWCAATDGHLLAPIDIVRTAAGHEAVFPLCQRRLDELLHERIEAGAPPSAGECVTAAVSVLRGAAEAGDAPAGTWWLTDDGRPVLALGGGADVRDASLGILALLEKATNGAVRAALDAAAAAIADPRGDLAAAEDGLFFVAEPLALATTVLAPARARSVASTLRAEPPAPRRALREAVARHVDADVADRVLRARDDLSERWAAWRTRRAERHGRRAAHRRPGRDRGAAPTPQLTAGTAPSSRPRRVGRAPIVVGAVVAAIVLGAGLLWPSDEPGSTGVAATVPPSTPPTVSEPAGQPASEPSAATDAGASDDPQTVAEWLLTTTAACPDEACRDGLRETPGRPALDGVLALPAPEREVALVEDYGGVAVLRVSAVTPGTMPDRLLVIVETAQKWLIRDAYDVADQP